MGVVCLGEEKENGYQVAICRGRLSIIGFQSNLRTGRSHYSRPLYSKSSLKNTKELQLARSGSSGTWDPVSQYRLIDQ